MKNNYYPNDEKCEPNEENCQRMIRGEEKPTEYEDGNCQDCVYFSCKYMPAGAEEEFRQGEIESMFPEGIDDGFDSILKD